MAAMIASPLQSAFQATSLTRGARASGGLDASSRQYRRKAVLVRAVQSGSAAAASSSTDLVLVDHFSRLGVSRDATNAEIAAAYQARCKEITAVEDKAEVARQRLEALEISFDVLMSEEEKRLYLWGLMQKERPSSNYVWPYEADPSQRVITGTPPRELAPEDAEGIRKVGYFVLAWFILSIVLSLTLKPV